MTIYICSQDKIRRVHSSFDEEKQLKFNEAYVVHTVFI